MVLNYKEVAEILKMVDASNCQEVVVDVEGMRLVVRKGGEVSSAPGALDVGSASAETLPATSGEDPSTK